MFRVRRSRRSAVHRGSRSTVARLLATQPHSWRGQQRRMVPRLGPPASLSLANGSVPCSGRRPSTPLSSSDVCPFLLQIVRKYSTSGRPSCLLSVAARPVSGIVFFYCLFNSFFKATWFSSYALQWKLFVEGRRLDCSSVLYRHDVDGEVEFV